MKISIIIPTLNGASCLGKSLKAVTDSDYDNYEIIVSDCGSTDDTQTIAKKFDVRLIEVGNVGKGTARNKGVEAASGEIILFIDSDIVISVDALKRVSELFQANPQYDCINGVLSSESSDSGYFSQYKNLYMSYQFRQIPERIDFIFTSFTAMKREVFIPFEDTLKPKDTEVGQRMVKEFNRFIYLDKTLQVTHLKKYNFLTFYQNDFIVPYGWAKIFLKQSGVRDLVEKKRFAHSPKEQLLSVMLAPLIALLILLNPILHIPVFVVLFLIWFLLNLKFFTFLTKERGVVFGLIKAIPVTFLAHIIMAAGIVCGFLSCLFCKGGKN